MRLFNQVQSSSVTAIAQWGRLTIQFFKQPRHTSAPRGATRPRFCQTLSPFGNRGRGECRVPSAPAASCAKGRVANAHEYSQRVHRISPAFPHAMVLTVYLALSPVTNSSCHRRRRINGFGDPGWARKTSADLTPATGARTTRLRRTHMRRSSCVPDLAHGEQSALRVPRTPDAAASTASRPAFVTTRVRPSQWDETAWFIAVIRISENQNIFRYGTRHPNHTRSSPSGAR